MNLLLQNRLYSTYQDAGLQWTKGQSGRNWPKWRQLLPQKLGWDRDQSFPSNAPSQTPMLLFDFFLIAIINHFIPASVFDNDWLPFCRLHFSKLFTPLLGLNSEVSCILFFLWFQPPANHSVWWLFITQPWASVFVFLPALAWPSSSSFSPSWSRMCVPGGPLTHSMPHPLLPPLTEKRS